MTFSTRNARRTLAGVVAGALVAGSAALTITPGAEAAPKKKVNAYGLTAAGKLVSFNLARPDQADVLGKIKGLGEESLVGIDFRVATGKLYGVGDDGGLFIINARTTTARKVATLGVALEGGSFGVDVNPAADALRIVSNTGQNLRHSFATNVTTVDGTLNVPDTTPQVRGIVGAAYTNNDGDDTSGTALFDLNAATDSIALQIPANAGVITGQGPLGKKTTLDAGFDIHTAVVDGRAATNTAYATLGGKGGYALFKIATLTGKATRVGAFKPLVVDLAVVQG